MTPTPRELTVDRVAQAMYERVKASGTKDLPEKFTALEQGSVERYRLLAAAAVDALPYPADLIEKLAEALAWKLNNPMSYTETTIDALDLYEAEVGTEFVSADVKRAQAIR